MIDLKKMTAVFNALDAHTRAPVQIGENGHNEYGWSSNKQERLVQLSFQLVRSKDTKKTSRNIGGRSVRTHNLLIKNSGVGTLKNLGLIYYDLIGETLANISNEETNIDETQYLTNLVNLMLHTRDIINGKGEYAIFYELLLAWVLYDFRNQGTPKGNVAKEIWKRVIVTLVDLPEAKDRHPYGSWKDMKYFMGKLKSAFSEPEFDDITLPSIEAFQYIVTYMAQHMRREIEESKKDPAYSPTLAARWFPREKSQFGWQARHIACAMWPEWMGTLSTTGSKKSSQKAVTKCLTQYRIEIAALNKKIGTIQVNQCGGSWGEIDFDKQGTSITLARQRLAFQYVNKQGVSRGDSDDRRQCAENYTRYIEECKSGAKTIKGARVGLVELVRDAIDVHHFMDKSQCDSINLQWAESGKNLNSLKNFIAMVDTSASMKCDDANPFHAAIGLGIRVAENSSLGKRVLTFNSRPQWIDLGDGGTFVDSCHKLASDESWGMNTNFEAAMQLILDSCVDADLAPEQVEEMVLAIFSDMQIDQADSNAMSMNELMENMFAVAGMKTSHRRPYTPCHILYWNLRSTTGFPAVSTEKNISMLSGFSPVLINTLCEKGIEALKDATPWFQLTEMLGHERYVWTKAFIDNVQYNAFGLNKLSDSDPEATKSASVVEPVQESSWSGWIGWS